MAIFTAFQGVDMRGSVIFPFDPEQNVIDANQIRLEAAGGEPHWQFDGENITYEGDAYGDELDITGGTIEFAELGDGSGAVFELSLPGTHAARVVWDRITASDDRGLFAYLLNGNDSMVGSGVSDRLEGHAGVDKIFGGLGDDQLIGGTGKDQLSGGAGADTFVFDARAAQSSMDTIRDFKRSQDDAIELENRFFKVGAALNTSEFRSSPDINPNGGAANGEAKILYDSDSGRLYYDADGAGTDAAPVLFATLGTSTHPLLAHTDFVVI